MMSALDNRIPPPIVVVVLGAVMAAVAQVTPHWAMASSWRWAISAALFVAGLAIGGAGFAAFARAKMTIDPVKLESASVLVTAGVFRFSRNPMYVGFAMLLTAWAVLLAAPWTFAGVVAFVLFIGRFQIAPEEKVMSAKFGAAYADYRSRVRRWL